MAIKSFNLLEIGAVGKAPKIWQIETDNTLNQVTAAGYLDGLIDQGVSIADGDMALISCKTSPNATARLVYWLQIAISNGISTMELITANASDSSVGFVNPVETVTELKNIDVTQFVETGVQANLIVDAATNPRVAAYMYSMASTTAGNDDTIVTPASVTEPDPGRWLKITDRQIAGIVADTEHGYYATDAGAADAYDASIAGTISAPSNGLRIWLTPSADNTGACTLDVETSGSPVPIKLQDGNDPAAGDIKANKIAHLVYLAGAWQLINPLTSGGGGGAPTGATYYTRTNETASLPGSVNMGALATGLVWQDVAAGVATPRRGVPHNDYSVDELVTAGGAADAYTAAVDAGVTAYFTGMRIMLLVNATNTGASTLNVNAIGAQNIKLRNGNDPIAGDMLAGAIAELVYNGTDFQLMNAIVSNNTPGTPNVNFCLSNTGILDGGELTINGGNPAQFDVAAGSGVIVDNTDPDNPVVTPVTIAASAGNTVTNIATAPATFVYVNSAGTLLQTTTKLDESQIRSNVYLGTICHPDNATISGIQVNPIPSYDNNGYSIDFYRSVGLVKVEGNEISPNGANLQWDKSPGKSLGKGINYANDNNQPNITTDPAGTGVTFTYQYRDGGGGWTYQFTQTNIIPGFYDNGSGTLQAVGGSQWTNQRLFYFPGTQTYNVFYGQTLYTTQNNALAALESEDFVESDESLLSAIFLGWLTTKGNETALNSSNATFTQASIFRLKGVAGAGATTAVDALQASKIEIQGIKASAGTINPGTPVSIVGWDAVEGIVEVEPADSDNAARMPFSGIASETMTGAAKGKLIVTGVYAGFDNSGNTAGQQLYVGTTAGGSLVNARPNGDTVAPQVAAIALDNQNPGQIFVMGAVDSNNLPNLTNNYFWMGNANAQPVAVTMTGDVTMTNTGVATIANDAVTAAKIASQTLKSISVLGSAADKMLYSTAPNTWAEADLTTFARSLLDDANQAAAQATLGLVPGTNVQAWDADLDAIAALAGTGIAVRTAANTWAERSIAGTANEIDLGNGDGVLGNPTVGLADNLIMPGNAAFTLVSGTTAQEPAGAAGQMRYDTDTNQVRYHNGTSWVTVSTGISSPVAIADGGTGATTALGATQNLGVEVGVDVQAYDAGLQSISGLVTAADEMIYTTALDTYSTTSLTAFARTLLDDANQATAQATLGVVPGTDVQAYDAGLQSLSALPTAADKYAYSTAADTWAEGDITAFARTVLDDATAADARTTLGAAAESEVLKKDGSVALTANWDISAGSFFIKIPTPAATADAANKGYVDTAVAGLGAYWTPVRVETQAELNATYDNGAGTLTSAVNEAITIDGIALSLNDRVLVDKQTTGATEFENGIYEVTTVGDGVTPWVLTRTTDADQSAEFTTNKTVFVQEGTCTGCVLAYDGPDSPTLGVTAIAFTLKQTATNVADGSITNAKLATDAVTAIKIQNGAVENTKLADATLKSLADLGTAADRYAYTTGVDTWVEGTITAFGRSLLDDANAAAAQTTLSLVPGANVQAYDATLAALAAYNTNGILTQTAADTFTGRTITGTANEVTVTDGDGVLGNPTISLPASIDLGGKTLEIPNSAAPTVSVAGQIAVDTSITDYTGLIKYHDGVEELTVVGMPTANLSTSDGYAVVYDAANNEFTMALNGGGAFTMDSTGVLTGGVLSTGAGASQYSISDGTGRVVDAAGNITEVSWTGKTNITPTFIATSLISFVGIDVNGNVVEQTTAFTNAQSRDIIVLGVVVHVDLATVDAVNNEQHASFNVLSQLNDLTKAIGFFNVSGNLYSPNGANLNIDKSVGTMYGVGVNYNNDIDNPNLLTLPALTAATFQYRFSNGSNGVTGITIDPANLDDGAGGLTPLTTNNKWSVQRIYSFTSNNVKIQRGVQEYDTKDAAIAGISSEPFVTEPSIAANGLLRGFLAAQKNATDLSDPNQAVFIEATKFQSGAGSGGAVVGSQFADTDFRIYDDGDSTKQIAFEAGGITTGTTRTITMPDGNVTLLTNPLANTLNDTQIFVGNGSNVATGVAMSGDMTLANTGAVTAANALITGKTAAVAAVADEILFSDADDAGNLKRESIDDMLALYDAKTATLTNKTFDANGTGNSISNIDVADLANGTDGELITWDATGAPATVGAGTAGQVLTSNGAGAAPTFQAAASGDATSRPISQAGHGFTVGAVTPVYWNGSAYVGSNASAAATADVDGLAVASDINNFTLYLDGSYISGHNALVADTDYYVGTSAGALTATEPGLGNISKPVYSTVTTTDGYFKNYRGITVSATGTLTDSFIYVGNASNVAVGVALSGDATIANTGVITIADDAVTLAKMASGTAGNLITYDAAGDPAAVATGTAGQVLTSNGAGAEPTFQDAAAGDAVKRTITQAAHGLTVGTLYPMYYNGSSYVVADSSIASTAEAVWVGWPTDINTIDLYADGSYLSGFTALTANTQYFVSNTGGAITSTEPANGEISKPVFKTITTTTGQVEIYRGVEVSEGGSGNVVFSQTLNNQATCDIDNLPTNYDYFEVELVDVLPATDSVSLYAYSSSDGGATFDTGAADYGWMVEGQYVTGGGSTTMVALDQGDSSDALIKLNGNRTMGNTAGRGANGTITIHNPKGTDLTNFSSNLAFTGTAAGEMCKANGSSQRLASADVDAFRIAFSSGNIASGKVIVRGYNSTDNATGGAPQAAVAKAWATFDGNGGATINDAYAVASVVRNVAGNYSVTLDTPMSTADYVIVCNCEATAVSSFAFVYIDNKTTTGFNITINNSAFGQVDGGNINFVIYGTQ